MTIDQETNFFGRKDILDLLKKRAVGLKEGYRQNVAFLGGQFIGKTSIIQKFLSDLDDEAIITVYLDLENKDFTYIYEKFVGSILYNFSKTKQFPLHDDISLLMENARHHIPRTIEEIKKIQESIAKGKIVEAYRQIISLPETFTIESGKFCVIALDEFHSLDDLSIPNVFVELGKKIMMQKRCIYLVTSSSEIKAQRILSEKLSLLFGNFELVRVDPFDLQTSRAFVVHNLGQMKIGDQLKNFLTDFTGGHPLYLNLISKELLRLGAIHKQEGVFRPLLLQAIEDTIFDRWGVLSRHFELIVNNLCQGKGNCLVASLLITLANGKYKIAEMTADIGIKRTHLLQRITKLMEIGVVVKNGNFYHFQDKLFKYWVKYVFQKRLKAISLDDEKLKEKFREELEEALNHFERVSKKDFSDRIIELLHCFDNEAYRLNGRKYKLPLFREITPLKMESGEGKVFDVIKAATASEVWFLVLEQHRIAEDDLMVFLAESQKYEERPQKKIIISLNDLEQNARLKALQERMWIWSESELNTLLNLYDKPYIVR